MIGIVVGNPMVFYNKDESAFGWCTSDVLEKNEIKILVLRKGIFGGVCPSIAEIINDKDLWEYVELTIRYGGRNNEG
jgi:hypothetical protein